VVRLSLQIGPGQQEALIRVMRSTRPRLLAVEDPGSVALLGACPEAGEVAACIGLAEPLAEDELAAQDLVDIGIFLLLRSMHQQRGSEQAHSEAAQDDGGSGLRHLLLVDGLHHRGCRATTGLAGPGQLQPPALVELALPLALELSLVVLAESPHSAMPPFGREVEIEPASDLVPEAFLFCGKAKIHDLEAIKPGIFSTWQLKFFADTAALC